MTKILPRRWWACSYDIENKHTQNPTQCLVTRQEWMAKQWNSNGMKLGYFTRFSESSLQMTVFWGVFCLSWAKGKASFKPLQYCKHLPVCLTLEVLLLLSLCPDNPWAVLQVSMKLSHCFPLFPRLSLSLSNYCFPSVFSLSLFLFPSWFPREMRFIVGKWFIDVATNQRYQD